jgi:Mn-dependent DtxR family transcriptional regulator
MNLIKISCFGLRIAFELERKIRKIERFFEVLGLIVLRVLGRIGLGSNELL